MQTSTIQLSGLTCEACTKISLKRLSRIPDVSEVKALAQQGNFELTATRPITKEEISEVLKGTSYSLLSA